MGNNIAIVVISTATTPPARVKTFLSTFSTPPHYLCILTEMLTHYFTTSTVESNICHIEECKASLLFCSLKKVFTLVTPL